MYEDALATIPLFRELSWRELSWLGEACRERDYAPGDHLQRQDGTGAVGLLIIMSGAVHVTRTDRDGAEHDLGEFAAGAMLGEQTLLEDIPASATITASEPTHALALPIWEFRLTLREYPDLAIHLIAILGQRLRQATERDDRDADKSAG